MPRIIAQELQTALDNGSYTPYFAITICNDTEEDLVLTPIYCKLTNLAIEATAENQTYRNIYPNITKIFYTRGVVIEGILYTISTSKFFITSTTWDGAFQKFSGHLFFPTYYLEDVNASGAITYRDFIENFCLASGRTSVHEDDTAAWLTYAFEAAGKNILLDNQQSFLNILQQKRFLFATDKGNEQVLFYDANKLKEDNNYLTVYRYEINKNSRIGRQFSWVDENGLRNLQIYKSMGYRVNTYTNYILSIFRSIAGIVLITDYEGHILYNAQYGSGQNWYVTGNFGSPIYKIIDAEVYLVCASGKNFKKSTDHGLTWQTLSSIPEDVVSLLYVEAGIILAGTQPNGKIYRSTNYGASWTEVAIAGQTWIHSLEQLLTYHVIFAGTEPNAKIYKSTDNGATWVEIANLSSGTGSPSKVLSLKNLGGSSILAGTDQSLFITISNPYTSWTELFYGGASVFTIEILNKNNEYLFSSGDLVKFHGDAGFSTLQTLTGKDIRFIKQIEDGTILVGTGNTGDLYKIIGYNSLPTHNLGYLETTDFPPEENFQIIPSVKFDPLPPNLNIMSGDCVLVTLPGGEEVTINCAKVTEILDTSLKNMAWRIIVEETEWLTNTAGGSIPNTVAERGAFIPLASTGFDGNLTPAINNLQAFAQAVDDLDVPALAGVPAHDHSGGDGAQIPTGGIANDAVTYAKLQNVSATNILLGRSGAGSGNVQEIACTAQARSLLDDATGLAMQATLGLVTASYTPTLVNIANVDASTALSCYYMRLGNMVTVWGECKVNPTTISTLTKLSVSLPVASNFTIGQQAVGSGMGTGLNEPALIYGSPPNDNVVVEFVAASVNNHNVFFNFTYIVL